MFLPTSNPWGTAAIFSATEGAARYRCSVWQAISGKKASGSGSKRVTVITSFSPKTFSSLSPQCVRRPSRTANDRQTWPRRIRCEGGGIEPRNACVPRRKNWEGRTVGASGQPCLIFASWRIDPAPASVAPRPVPSRAGRPLLRHVVDARGAERMAAQEPGECHPSAAP
jgi:hypothetical protein